MSLTFNANSIGIKVSFGGFSKIFFYFMNGLDILEIFQILNSRTLRRSFSLYLLLWHCINKKIPRGSKFRCS